MKKLTEKELLLCRKYFADQDQNRDSKLSWHEYNEMIDAIGIKLTELEKHKSFQIADKNGNGFISFTEFVEACVKTEFEMENEACEKLETIKNLSQLKIIQIRDRFYTKTPNSGFGKLSPLEFVEMIATLGIVLTNEELMTALDLANEGNNELISFERFSTTFIKEDAQTNYDSCLLKPLNKRKVSESANMTEFEIIECCKYFWYSDKDSDGKLSPSEFLNMLGVLQIDKTLDYKQKICAFESADVDGDGLVSFHEFVNAYLNKRERKYLTNKNIKEFFNKFDKDENGILSRSECIETLKMLGHKFRIDKLDRIIDAMDTDHDQKISLAEFCEFLDIE